VITLVIGGTRSGKSEIAERIAGETGSPVTVVTPGLASDPDMSARIAAHRARRPSSWTTVECGPDLVGALEAAEGVTLVDSLGSWVAATKDFDVDTDALLRALVERRDPTVVVTEEVGLSVHPQTDVGRAFADAVGALNTRVATVADDALLVVAGRTLRLDP
jgi:adenosyl cobinamide kinase/adenosyl cobinamide phosphate guanylyltransferase